MTTVRVGWRQSGEWRYLYNRGPHIFFWTGAPLWVNPALTRCFLFPIWLPYTALYWDCPSAPLQWYGDHHRQRRDRRTCVSGYVCCIRYHWPWYHVRRLSVTCRRCCSWLVRLLFRRSNTASHHWYRLVICQSTPDKHTTKIDSVLLFDCMQDDSQQS